MGEEIQDETATMAMMDYNKNSDLQSDFNQLGNKLLTENAYSLSKISPNELTIADFGCSHGKNYMACIKAALDGYLEIKETISVLVHMNDLPSNDFEEVTKCLNDPKLSYHEHAFSYFKRILPKNSLHLGPSFNCLHWLDKPIKLSQGLFPGSTMTTPEERITIVNNAQEELTIFLQARHQELKSKGRLVLNVFKDWNLTSHFDLNWLKYITSKGFNKHQLINVTIPKYFRPIEEINCVLEKFKDEFTVSSSQSQLINSEKFTHETFRSLFFNVLVKGVTEANLFASSTEVENFVEGYILFFSKDQLDLTLEMQFITLEKN